MSELLSIKEVLIIVAFLSYLSYFISWYIYHNKHNFKTSWVYKQSILFQKVISEKHLRKFKFIIFFFLLFFIFFKNCLYFVLLKPIDGYSRIFCFLIIAMNIFFSAIIYLANIYVNGNVATTEILLLFISLLLVNLPVVTYKLMSPLKNEEKEREINILNLISYLGLAMMFLLFLSSTPTEIDLKYGEKINEIGTDSTQILKKLWLQLHIISIGLPFGIWSLIITRFALWYFPRIK